MRAKWLLVPVLVTALALGPGFSAGASPRRAAPSARTHCAPERLATHIYISGFDCRIARASVERWVGRPHGCGRVCFLSGIVNGPSNGVGCTQKAQGGTRCDVHVRKRSGTLTFVVRPQYR